MLFSISIWLNVDFRNCFVGSLLHGRRHFMQFHQSGYLSFVCWCWVVIPSCVVAQICKELSGLSVCWLSTTSWMSLETCRAADSSFDGQTLHKGPWEYLDLDHIQSLSSFTSFTHLNKLEVQNIIAVNVYYHVASICYAIAYSTHNKDGNIVMFQIVMLLCPSIIIQPNDFQLNYNKLVSHLASLHAYCISSYSPAPAMYSP